MSSNIFGAFGNNAADSITKTKSNVDRMYPTGGGGGGGGTAAEYQYYYPQNPYYQDAAMPMDHPIYNNMYQHGYGVRAETTGYAGGNAGGGGYDAPNYQNNGGYSTVQNYGPPQQNYNYGGGGGGGGHSQYGNSGGFSNYGGGGGGGGGGSYGQSYTHSSTPRHKSKGIQSAMSALTLLAFLFFLNILQSCLKEHMNTMNPTVMVMTAGAGRQSTAQKKSNEYPLIETKIDSDYEMYNTADEFNDDKRKMESNTDDNYEQIRTVKSNPYRNNTFISSKLRKIDKN